MTQETLDLVQSILIGILVLRNISLSQSIKKYQRLLMQTSKVSLKTSMTVMNILEALNKTKKPKEEQSLKE